MGSALENRADTISSRHSAEKHLAQTIIRFGSLGPDSFLGEGRFDCDKNHQCHVGNGSR
jgi:hypothetical protein